MPYQSIYLNGQEVISGRRRDLQERLLLIPEEAISGKRILDMACNVGMSSILARNLGARSCVGLEYSQAMVDIATRFAMFCNAYPATQFRQFNIDTDSLDNEMFDTAFIFSIHDHLKQPHKLSDIVAKNVKTYVVFEGHPGGKAEDYAGFLASGIFKSVDEIGRLHTSRNRLDRSRVLWLCKIEARA